MSHFGPVLLVLAAQVTLPVLGGLALSRRRDPAAACIPLVAAAILVLLLTPLAFAPRVQWPTAFTAQTERNASMELVLTNPITQPLVT